MRTELITNLPGLAPLLPQWEALAGGVPFRQWSWLGPWWHKYGTGHDLFVLATYSDAGDVVGLSPWYAENLGAQGRTIRQLGSGEVCSDYLTILARPGLEIAVGEAIGSWLIASDAGTSEEGGSGQWDVIELAGIAPEDASLATLQARMAAAGYTVHEQPALNTWRIALPTEWEAYVSSLSKPNRRRVRDCQKRLAEADVVRHVATTPEQLEAGWQVLVDLHQQRWTAQGQKGCFASGSFGQFLRAAAEQLLAEEKLRLSWIEIGCRPAASLIAIEDQGVTYAYQTGMATELLRENPGWMIQSAAIRDAIASGCRGFDLLRGNEAYKGHLGAEPRAMADRRIVSQRLAPQLCHTAWLTGNLVKNVIKSFLSAT